MYYNKKRLRGVIMNNEKDKRAISEVPVCPCFKRGNISYLEKEVFRELEKRLPLFIGKKMHVNELSSELFRKEAIDNNSIYNKNDSIDYLKNKMSKEEIYEKIKDMLDTGWEIASIEKYTDPH